MSKTVFGESVKKWTGRITTRGRGEWEIYSSAFSKMDFCQLKRKHTHVSNWCRAKGLTVLLWLDCVKVALSKMLISNEIFTLFVAHFQFQFLSFWFAFYIKFNVIIKPEIHIKFKSDRFLRFDLSAWWYWNFEKKEKIFLSL